MEEVRLFFTVIMLKAVLNFKRENGKPKQGKLKLYFDAKLEWPSRKSLNLSLKRISLFLSQTQLLFRVTQFPQSTATLKAVKYLQPR